MVGVLTAIPTGLFNVAAVPPAAAREVNERGASARGGPPLSPAEQATAAWLERHRHHPPQLRSFLLQFPKGADLHSHLSGAVYAEHYLEWGAEEGWCIDRSSLQALAPEECRPGKGQVRMTELTEQPDLYSQVVNRWSLRHLPFAGRPGHDQFFEAFEFFGPISGAPSMKGRMVAEVARRAADQRIHYLELMLTTQGDALGELAKRLSGAASEDLAASYARLLQLGLPDLVLAGGREIDAIEAQRHLALGCPAPATNQPSELADSGDRGCRVTVRYLQQTNRTKSPERVFTQLAFAFTLASSHPDVVGINLVAPEDHPIALRDYRRQMEMVGFLRRRFPDVKVALHAGELTLGLVPPEALRFHIIEAVDVAGAHRIGHGVDLAHERDSLDLLERMRQRDVLVEICLTSNETILNVEGPDHPFDLYRQAAIPLTLASDDEGIARIDLSHEYQLATERYPLSYGALKQLARNSLTYSFLPGESLWLRPGSQGLRPSCSSQRPGVDSPAGPCASLLAGSEKARQQWRLEVDFDRFEREFTAHTLN